MRVSVLWWLDRPFASELVLGTSVDSFVRARRICSFDSQAGSQEHERRNLETSTAALSVAAALHYPEKPPTAIFSYGRPVRGATPAAAVSVDFTLDVTTWTWHRDTVLTTGPIQALARPRWGNGGQITASDVSVMLMHEYATQYTEEITGAHENGLVFKGSGPAWVFRGRRRVLFPLGAPAHRRSHRFCGKEER